MTNWVYKGLRKAVVTSRWPHAAEAATGVTPGRPLYATPEAAAACPTAAMTEHRATVELTRCIHCQRCRLEGAGRVEWQADFQWARWTAQPAPLPPAFARSIHVRVVDAGDCGACLAELLQLPSPHYSLHRLGIFFTATPRQADVLLVVGPVTVAMRGPLRNTYEAMPEPRRVVAVGTCACSGGLFGPTYACDGGIADVIPVDLQIPGCPPPPLAILDGLLRVMGRQAPAGAGAP